MAVAATRASEAARKTAIKLVPAREAKSKVASWVLSPSSARNTVPNTVASSLRSMGPSRAVLPGSWRSFPLCLQLGEPLAKRPLFLPPARLVPDDRRDEPGARIGCKQQRDREGDGERAAVLVDRRNAKHFGAVPGVACPHDFPIAVPVSLTIALGNDEVERPAERLPLGVAENALGGRVPDDDGAVRARDHDRVARISHELSGVELSAQNSRPPAYGKMIPSGEAPPSQKCGFTCKPRRRIRDGRRRVHSGTSLRSGRPGS